MGNKSCPSNISMKILQLLGCRRLGGTETFAIDLVSRLSHKNIDIYLANLWVPSEMHDVASRKLGDRYIGIEGGYWISPATVWRTVQLFRTYRFDIIHAYGLRPGLLARLIGGFSACKHICLGIRGLDEQRTFLQSFLDRATEGLVDKVVCNAQAVADIRMKREKTKSDKIVVIPNGIDTNRFDPARLSSITRNHLDLSQEDFLIACVGNFRPEKDHDNLVHAVAAIKNEIAGVKFLLIGQDPKQKEIEALVQELGLEDYFVFTGPRQDIPEVLSVVDAFVLPSRSEGMPRALMEAMAMALPVVATDAGGTVELIENYISGIIVPKKNPDALAVGLMKVISDASLRRRIGPAARERILTEFSLNSMVDRYISFYQAMVANGAGFGD